MPVCRLIAPAVTDDSGAEPESASILLSNWVTLSVMLIWLLPEAPDAWNVMFWPLTVMVSPTANAVVSASLLVVAVPESTVAPVIAAGPPVVERLIGPVRPSLASVAADEPVRLISAVVLVVRSIEPAEVLDPPVARSIAVGDVVAIVPVEISIDRLLVAIEPVSPPPEWKEMVLLLTTR